MERSVNSLIDLFEKSLVKFGVAFLGDTGMINYPTCCKFAVGNPENQWWEDEFPFGMASLKLLC